MFHIFASRLLGYDYGIDFGIGFNFGTGWPVRTVTTGNPAVFGCFEVSCLHNKVIKFTLGLGLGLVLH